MGISKEQAREAFEKAVKDIPYLTEGRELVSIGNFGLVLADECDVITKVLFRHKEDYWNSLSAEHAQNEVDSLRYLSAHPLRDVATPCLLAEPVSLDHYDYSSYYQMSRLPGRSMSWYPHDGEAIDSERLKLDGIASGRALAQFHRSAANIPKNVLNKANPIKLGRIHVSSNLPDHVNDALIAADAYLQEHKVLGIVHGDFHGGNIMTEEGHRVSGLIDFGFTGYANLYYDFIKAKPHFMPALIEGYEAESGQSIDRHLITASILGRYSARLIKLDREAQDLKTESASQKQERSKVTSTIIEGLKDISAVTGLSVDF